MDGATSSKQTSSAHSLGGRVVAGGAESCRELGRLLGIDRLRADYRVAAVAWMDHALEVAVTSGPEHSFVFRIERRTPESKGLVVTDKLNVFSRGTKMPAELATSVRDAVSRNIGRWSTDRLAEIVERDPESGKPGLAMPPQPEEGTRPASLLDTWGAEDSHADFFAGGEMARSQLDSIDPSKVFHFIQHCDNECLYVNPHSVGTITSMVNFPWDDRIREPTQPTDQAMGNLADREFIAEGMVTTDLDEDDVIRGNPEKLLGLLRYATERPSSEDKVIFVSNTCVPTVIGEDVESVVDQVREESGREMLYLTVTPRSMVNVFHGLLVERRLAAEHEAPPPDPSSLNLIGFADSRARRELEQALGSLGIRVNARLFPELTPQLVESLPGGALNVLYPNKLWQHLYDQLIDRSRIEHVTPAAPFGVTGTRAWLSEMASRMGQRDGFDAAWETLYAPHAERWEQLRARASKHRLGFVVRDTEAFYLTTPASTWGVPLVALAEQMGFGVDVLIRASDKRQTRRTARAVQALFREPERHTIAAFNTFDKMRSRLAESKAEAFLSYHFFDWRLTEAGKASFSIQHFEMGIEGAIRTVDRLVRLCETGFYRKYSRYLKRSGVGLRVPAEAKSHA